jgi:hypothetical protein
MKETCKSATAQGYNLLTTQQQIDCLPHTGMALTMWVLGFASLLVFGYIVYYTGKKGRL